MWEWGRKLAKIHLMHFWNSWFPYPFWYFDCHHLLLWGEGGAKAMLLVGYWHICFIPGNFIWKFKFLSKFIYPRNSLRTQDWFWNCYVTIHGWDECHQRLLEFGNLEWTCIYRAINSGMVYLPFFCKGWFKLSFRILIKKRWRSSMIYIPFEKRK